ncbi:hypothetical protein [Ferrimonas balearica]|uniref:hypothetical protein n=1 Tax=Ferrimonas balearica TaxID=44012 RepID=UPI001C99A4B2|nr:hypothetical protein [Ferrimonas balearica]MBY5992431.1 hypothetical protein [Ferrimonas balearica]
MKTLSLTALAAALALTSVSAQARIEGGFGYDQGFGVLMQFDNKLNAFIGNDGVAVDYLFARGAVTQVEEIPVSWYVGGGAFVGWDDGYGVRVPFGLEFHLNNRWDAFVQIAPDLDFDDSAKFGVDGAIGIRYAF